MYARTGPHIRGAFTTLPGTRGPVLPPVRIQCWSFVTTNTILNRFDTPATSATQASCLPFLHQFTAPFMPQLHAPGPASSFAPRSLPHLKVPTTALALAAALVLGTASTAWAGGGGGGGVHTTPSVAVAAVVVVVWAAMEVTAAMRSHRADPADPVASGRATAQTAWARP